MVNDGSCVRLRPKYRNHVWSYDFVQYRTDDGKLLRTLNILDEFGRECLNIKVDRKLNSTKFYRSLELNTGVVRLRVFYVRYLIVISVLVVFNAQLSLCYSTKL